MKSAHLFLTLVCLTFSIQLHANPWNLDVEYKGDSFEKWVSVCEDLALNFRVGEGPFGFGLFDSYECVQKGASAKSPWKMIVQEKSGKWQVSIRHGDHIEAMATLDAGDYFLDVIQEKEIQLVLAWLLLDQLPAFKQLNSEEIEDLEIEAEDDRLEEKEIPSLPDRGLIITLDKKKTGKSWQIDLKGTASGDKKNRSGTLHGRKRLVSQTFTLDLKTPGDQKLFVLDTNGRGARSKALSKALAGAVAKKVQELEEGLIGQSAAAIGVLIKGVGASGYFGLRYGAPLLEGELISKSTFFGILAEIRSGFFDGLRVYFDRWPTVTDQVQGETASFGGQRTIFGYSLKLEFDSFISGIDLTPKIGSWTFTTEFPVEQPDATFDVLAFEVKNALSFEGEIGIESSSYWYILRAWGSRAFSVKKDDESASVINSRAGVDWMIRGPELGESVSMSFLLFTFFESVDLSRPPEGDLGPNETRIDTIEYSQAYGGGGIALSW